MNTLEFAELVDRVELQAKAHPGRYRNRVCALALLGFVVMGSAVLLAVAVAGLATFVLVKSPGMIWALSKFILIPVVMVGALGRALLTRTAPPEGEAITREQAPRLFECIERVRAATGAMPMDVVLITPEFNAFAAEVPRFGPFGVRRYLGIGLPLMQGLPPEEVEAVIAHEFGHFSNRHGRIGSAIYRMRRMWLAMAKSADFGVLNRFLSWYAPYFNAYSFVMARQQEFVADRAAADALGAPVMARALSRISLLGLAADELFWGRMATRVAAEDKPPTSIFREFAQFLRQPVPQALAARVVQQVTGHDDTHPALPDRLKAIGQAAAAPPFARSAAEEWLGVSATKLVAAFSARWHDDNRERWLHAHEQSVAARSREAELGERGDLSLDESFERLELSLERLSDADERIALLRAFNAQHEHAGARFRLGMELIGRDEAGALALFAQARSLDPDAALPIAHVLASHFMQAGRRAEAAPYIALVEKDEQETAQDVQARSVLPKPVDMERPNLSAETVATIASRLKAVRVFESAHVVQVRMQTRPDLPHYVIELDRRWTRLFRGNSQQLDAFAKDLEIGGTWLVVRSTDLSSMQQLALRQKAVRIPAP